MKGCIVFVFSFLLLQACSNEQSIQGKEKNIHNYEVYYEDENISELSIETGVFDSGYKKLLQIGIDYGTEGVVIYKSAIEKKIDEGYLTWNDIIIEPSDLDGYVYAYEKVRDLGFRSYFKQDISQAISFDNYVGFCTGIKDSRGGLDCSTGLKINQLRVKLTYDKSQIHRFADFKAMAEEAVADYVPKHQEKYGERENPFKR